MLVIFNIFLTVIFFLYKGFSANTVKGGMRISENCALTLKSSWLSLDKGFRAVRVRYTVRCLPVLSCFSSQPTTCRNLLVWNQQWKPQNNRVVLVSLLLILNRCHRLFWCFHCWFQTSKFRLGMDWKKRNKKEFIQAWEFI